jgi:hypothetical protein
VISRILRDSSFCLKTIMSSPTQRTLKMLRDEGWELVQVVEHWNSFARIRQDLFGVVDVLAVGHGETLAVQTTSYSNVSARVTKIAESDAIAPLREAGWAFHVHGWHKKKNRWQCRVVDMS